jgi:hypothetical protein
MQQLKYCWKRDFLLVPAGSYNRDSYRRSNGPPVEAGSNTSTVALRVVGGDEKGTQCLGYNWTTQFLGIQIRGPGPPGWGSLESERVKYGHESRGTRTRE